MPTELWLIHISQQNRVIYISQTYTMLSRWCISQAYQFCSWNSFFLVEGLNTFNFFFIYNKCSVSRMFEDAENWLKLPKKVIDRIQAQHGICWRNHLCKYKIKIFRKLLNVLHVLFCVFLFMLCLLLYGSCCHEDFKPDWVCFVCNISSLNMSFMYICKCQK